MKDAEARAMIGELRAEREAFRAEIVAQLEAGLRPVAVQAARAAGDSQAVLAGLAGLQEQLEVLASEGNTLRVDVNALREAVLAQQETVGTLVKNLQSAVGGFTVVETPVEGMPTAMNRAARREITRQGRPVQGR